MIIYRSAEKIYDLEGLIEALREVERTVAEVVNTSEVQVVMNHGNCRPGLELHRETLSDGSQVYDLHL